MATLSTDRRELDTERWRNVGEQLKQLTNTVSIQAQIGNANLGELNKLTAAVQALSAELSQIKADNQRHPIRQLWESFLSADWRGKLALMLLPSLTAYAWAGGQSLPALLQTLLETAHMCATGAPNGRP